MSFRIIRYPAVQNSIRMMEDDSLTVALQLAMLASRAGSSDYAICDGAGEVLCISRRGALFTPDGKQEVTVRRVTETHRSKT
jgi:hypothetical protein